MNERNLTDEQCQSTLWDDSANGTVATKRYGGIEIIET